MKFISKVFGKGKTYGDSKILNNNVTFYYDSINDGKVYGCSKLYGYGKWNISQNISQQEKNNISSLLSRQYIASLTNKKFFKECLYI